MQRPSALVAAAQRDTEHLLCGANNKVCKRVLPFQLIGVQRLKGQQEAVVQHADPLKESSVRFHLAGKPGFFLT